MEKWVLSPGPERPLWEPVRLVDFDGERRDALIVIRDELRATPIEDLSDEDLAMLAILNRLFDHATVRLDTARAEAIILATKRLPTPKPGRRRLLKKEQREDMLVMVGRAWSIFIGHNFPLNQPRFNQAED